MTQDAEVQMIQATQEMHWMCLEALSKVVNDYKLLRLFNIPSDLWPAVRSSYRSGALNGLKALPDLLGRFDWSWDGKNPPKLLEYNADTPSMILESSEI